jgi:hypothetical protein
MPTEMESLGEDLGCYWISGYVDKAHHVEVKMFTVDRWGPED